jgi:hypothetical protein
MLFRPVSFLLSLAALTVVSSALSARAETPSDNPTSGHSESSAARVPAVEPAGKTRCQLLTDSRLIPRHLLDALNLVHSN